MNQQELVNINNGLKAQKAGVTIQLRGKTLSLRAILPSKEEKGAESQQRVLIGEKANSIGLAKAYQLALQLSAEKQSGTFLWSNWGKEAKQNKTTVKRISNTTKDWLAKFESHFWQGRVETSASKRTWQRIKAELNRLDQNKILRIDELTQIAKSLEPGSKRRHEFCKVAKRLAVFADLAEISKLEAVRTPYQPSIRKLPKEEALQKLIHSLRGDSVWGWCTAAMFIYGCRPSEVFSLQPKADGTAQVLTIKKQRQIPAWRTALALPQELISTLQILDVSKPVEYKSPQEYDSLEAKSWTDRWNKWLKLNCDLKDLQLYDIRHAWAIRSIRLNLSTGAGAKAMGHDVNVHVKTYMSAIEEADMVALAASLRK